MEGLSLLRRDEMSSSAGGKNTHCHFPHPFQFPHSLSSIVFFCFSVCWSLFITRINQNSFSLLLPSIALFVFVFFFLPIFRSLSSFLSFYFFFSFAALQSHTLCLTVYPSLFVLSLSLPFSVSVTNLS